MRIAVILLLASLAGCMSDGPDQDAPDQDDPVRLVPVDPEQDFSMVIENDHVSGQTGHIGHQLPELHAHGFNLDLASFNDLSDGLTQPASGFTEVHVVQGMAVVSSLTGSRGATLVDVSDPTAMRVLSHLTNLDDNWDARLSADLMYLFLGCQGSAAFDCTSIDAGGEGSPAGGGGPCVPLATCPGGIAVYSVEDPTDPALLGYLPMGFTHNVHTWMDEGLHFFANAAGNIGVFDPANGTFELAGSVSAVHDIHVQKHPITGDWLLYTGGGSGMLIYDVNDPYAPVELGVVEGPPAMWHEQTPMPCLIDGRHLTIGAGESGAGQAQPVAVVDTTDPRVPFVVGQWHLPGNERLTNQMSYRFSLHNIDGNCAGQVAVGHYHAGVWVFDVSTTARQAEPVTLGYYLPHERTASTGWNPVVSAPIGALVSGDTPNVWTAQWSADGATLFVPDMTTGLYALTPQWTYEERFV